MTTNAAMAEGKRRWAMQDPVPAKRVDFSGLSVGRGSGSHVARGIRRTPAHIPSDAGLWMVSWFPEIHHSETTEWWPGTITDNAS
jgi:hypothetical protein